MISERTTYGDMQLRVVLVTILLIAAAAAFGCSAGANTDATATRNQAATVTTTSSTKLEVPGSIAAEHRELHEALEEAVRSGGRTGEAAKVVEERLAAHFEKEEQYALPQLGLLEALSAGNISADMKKAIDLSDKLKAEMPKMLEEHKGIVEALDALRSAAEAEKKQPSIEFAEKLGAHAQNEEQVMYPAAILVGEFLKLKLNQPAR